MDKTWAVIPDIYFDILARIVPGGFLIAITFILFEKQPVDELKSFFGISGIGWTIPFGIVISYYIAILFQHVYFFVDSRANRQMAQVSGVWQKLNHKFTLKQQEPGSPGSMVAAQGSSDVNVAQSLDPGAHDTSAPPRSQESQEPGNGLESLTSSNLESLKRVIAEMAGAQAVLGGLFVIASTLLLFLNEPAAFKLLFVPVLFFVFVIFYLWHNKLYNLLIHRMKILNTDESNISVIQIENIDSDSNKGLWEPYRLEIPCNPFDNNGLRNFFIVLLLIFVIRFVVICPLLSQVIHNMITRICGA